MKINTESKLFPTFLLAIVAIIWGGGFVFSNFAVMAGITQSLIIALRFGIPSALMWIFCFKSLAKATKRDWIFAVGAGAILFLGFLCQTYGISYTTPANNAFITSTNVIMVPFLGFAFFKQGLTKKNIACAFACFVGTAILSWSPSIGIAFNLGDWLTLLCAFLFSLHYAYLGMSAKYSSSTLILSAIQLTTTSILGFVFFAIFEVERFTWLSLKVGFWPMIYLGIFSTGFCYIAQIWAQRKIAPSAAAIILSAEGMLGSVFSVMLGFDPLTSNLVVGGLIIFASIVCIDVDFSYIWLVLFKQKLPKTV